MVNLNFAARPARGPLTQQTQPRMYADGYCTSRRWSGSLADESWAASCSYQTYVTLKIYTLHLRATKLFCPSNGFG